MPSSKSTPVKASSKSEAPMSSNICVEVSVIKMKSPSNNKMWEDTLL